MPIEPVIPEEVASTVADRFVAEPELQSLPVVTEQGHPMGIVRRDRFMELYASRYGRDLY
ncbi:hypothetical protein [Nitrosococcus wardiae]|uniref:hypothetical protein n=1 Tax=Nitrosococcus wardiae TaxID=1814290 RepID=UPI00141BEEF7|nr:hypothetical protein [Nitrosococcus wardiae]